jgi:hypothetical protein
MKNPCRFVAAVATLCLFASAAFAQPTLVGKAPAKVENGNSGNTAPALYDDPYNNGVYGFVAQEFSDYTSVSSRTYDDFVVPDGQTWCKEGMGGEGFYTALSNSSGCGVNYIFEIVRDAGGIPDCANNICTDTPPAYDPAIETANSFGQSGGRFDHCPGDQTELTAGTYWAAVAINMPFAAGTCGQWFFITSQQPHRRGSNAYLDTPNGGFGFPRCVNWTALGQDGDMTFTIYGNANTCVGGCGCDVRAGNTDVNVAEGGGGVPVDTLRVDGDTGGACRDVDVAAGSPVPVTISAPPSFAKGHYGLWINDGDELECCETVKCGAVDVSLGEASKCLAVNNTCTAGSVACPVTFPTGRTSKSLGAGTAALVCLNKKPGFPKYPVTFTDSFPTGDYTVQALIQDSHSINSPTKNIAISNAVAVHSL